MNITETHFQKRIKILLQIKTKIYIKKRNRTKILKFTFKKYII